MCGSWSMRFMSYPYPTTAKCKISRELGDRPRYMLFMRRSGLSLRYPLENGFSNNEIKLN